MRRVLTPGFDDDDEYVHDDDDEHVHDDDNEYVQDERGGTGRAAERMRSGRKDYAELSSIIA